MIAKPELVWKCPICGSEHSSEWRLPTHIGGMACIYTESHLEWALIREPELDTISPGTAASMLRRFVLAEVEPHYTDSEQLLDLLRGVQAASTSQHEPLELLSNLSEGYLMLAPMEIRLHGFVLQRLRDEYGDDDWRKRGVPQSVRVACSKRYEEDDNRYEWEQYLYLLELTHIIKERWHLFKSYAERLDKFPGKDQLMKWFLELNRLRNLIMHPLKGCALSQEDFEFLRGFSGRLEQFSEKL